MTERELHEYARDYLGVPFEHKGRKKSVLDCVGLSVLAARAKGWHVYDLRDYPRSPHDGMLERQIELNMGPPVASAPISAADLQPNDVVAMRMSPTGKVRHVGIIGRHPQGGLSLIHTAADASRGSNAWLGTGKVVEQRIDAPNDTRLLSLIAKVYRRTEP